jgi:hypothetical protein
LASPIVRAKHRNLIICEVRSLMPSYTPKQLAYGTGGPKVVENLFTREMLEEAFSDFDDLRIVEEEREIHEGANLREITVKSALIAL